MTGHMAEMWRLFTEACYPEGGVSPTQDQEMKRCYYAGAADMLQHLSLQIISDHLLTVPELRHLEDLAYELERFGYEIMAGRA